MSVEKQMSCGVLDVFTKKSVKLVSDKRVWKLCQRLW